MVYLSKNKMILVKTIIQTLLLLFLGLFFLETVTIGVENSMELQSGTVKLIRNGKSQILQNTGETYTLLANDRLQTGKESQITLYLKNRDNTVKLFSNSFFKLDDLAIEENIVFYPFLIESSQSAIRSQRLYGGELSPYVLSH